MVVNVGRSSRFLILALGLGACANTNTAMTDAEALEALRQAAESSRGESATQQPIVISTDFTIGAAVEGAAEQIAAWWDSQQDCTTVTVSGATTTVDFGDLDDDCVFQGRTYGGVARITVGSTSALQLEVRHDWEGLTNGDVVVDGGADVTWSGDDLTRRVITSHTWTGLDDGAVVDVEGDHIWGYLDPSRPLLGGFTLEGTRDWTVEGADWMLDMEGLEIRLQDPVPQAGTFLVTNPDGKQLDITFERLDEVTIQATLTGTVQPLVFHIDPLGRATKAE